MRKFLMTTVLFLCVIFLSGCLLSFNSPNDWSDNILDPNLIGTWESGQDDVSYEFKQKDAATYLLTVKDNDDVTKFWAQLFQLENNMYLVLFPEKGEKSLDNQMLPLYSTWPVKIGKDTLEYGFFNYEWFETMKDKIDLRTLKIKDNPFVFISDSKDLREFLKQYTIDGFMYHALHQNDKKLILHRVK